MNELFEPCTCAQTERLQRLINQSLYPTRNDILDLWEVFKDAESYVGQPGTLEDFGKWIAGVEPFEHPCEVTW